MKVQVTVVYEYDIPDDLEEREMMYGTQDPKECVQVDLDNGGVYDLNDYATIVHTQIDY